MLQNCTGQRESFICSTTSEHDDERVDRAGASQSENWHNDAAQRPQLVRAIGEGLALDAQHLRITPLNTLHLGRAPDVPLCSSS